jgi:vacuolar-type H+-ATPase subunit I/STV1
MTSRKTVEISLIVLLGIGAFIALMSPYAGLQRSLGWLGLTLGIGFIALVTKWFADAKNDFENNLALASRIISKVAFVVFAILLLFGVLVVLKVIVSPFWPLGGGESETYEGWRR